MLVNWDPKFWYTTGNLISDIASLMTFLGIHEKLGMVGKWGSGATWCPCVALRRDFLGIEMNKQKAFFWVFSGSFSLHPRRFFTSVFWWWIWKGKTHIPMHWHSRTVCLQRHYRESGSPTVTMTQICRLCEVGKPIVNSPKLRWLFGVLKPSNILYSVTIFMEFF